MTFHDRLKRWDELLGNKAEFRKRVGIWFLALFILASWPLVPIGVEIAFSKLSLMTIFVTACTFPISIGIWSRSILVIVLTIPLTGLCTFMFGRASALLSSESSVTHCRVFECLNQAPDKLSMMFWIATFTISASFLVFVFESLRRYIEEGEQGDLLVFG